MRSRILLAASGVIVVFVLFIFGKTVNHSSSSASSGSVTNTEAFDIQAIISREKSKLSPSLSEKIGQLENNIIRGDLKTQRSEQYQKLAELWNDSAGSFVPYAYYQSESAKLDNSEKNLTFAAQLILDNMRQERDPAVKAWESETAADLFRRALVLDPSNDDLKVGLGSSYVYGQGMGGNPQETMKGIQQLLEVVRKDSMNMKAQMVLGIGAVLSGQNDRAIERLNKVVSFDPENVEAVSWLADAYAAEGDKANAVKWYEHSKHLLNNPEFSKAVDERIKALNGPM